MRTLIEINLDAPPDTAERDARRIASHPAQSGLALAGAAETLLDPEISQVWRAHVAPLLASGDLCVEAVRVLSIAGGNLVAATATQCAANLDQVRALLEQAQRWRAARLTVTAGALDGDGAIHYQEGLNQTWAALNALAPDCERRGVRLAIRAGHGAFLTSPPELRELIDQVGSAWIGAHVSVAPECEPLPTPEDWLTTLGPRVFIVQGPILPDWLVPPDCPLAANLMNAVFVRSGPAAHPQCPE